MEKAITIQPCFRRKENKYLEQLLAGCSDCFFYEMEISEDILLIPNDSIDVLWDTENKQLHMYQYIDEYKQIRCTGRRFLGFHFGGLTQVEYEEEILKKWFEELDCLRSFEERKNVCQREWKKYISIHLVHPLLQRVIKQIYKEKGKTVMEDLAENNGYTKRHMERLFFEQFSYSPKEFCRHVRILYAIEGMLEQPEQKVSEQAELLGFSDASHFHREFKRMVGMTPKKFLEYFE